MIASDPPTIVHLITRAQGGLHDYQAFLHEAGHALHYAGCRPRAAVHVPQHLARPRADRDLLVHPRGDHPRARLARPHFGLSDEQAAENAEATTFLEALLFRRYDGEAPLRARLLGRFREDGGTPGGYAECLSAATGLRYRRDPFVSDMDAGFYSADYLRAWIRSAQLRAHLVAEIGEDWWRSPETGDAAARPLPRGHAALERGDRRPARLRPARHAPLLHELGA